jgi:hypothetical protein
MLYRDIMNVSGAKSLTLLRNTLASYTRWYGPGDPRTRAVERDLTAGKLAAAQAEVARLQAQLDAMPDVTRQLAESRAAAAEAEAARLRAEADAMTAGSAA